MNINNLEDKINLLEKIITRVGDNSNTTRNELYVVLKKLEKIEVAIIKILEDKKWNL